MFSAPRTSRLLTRAKLAEVSGPFGPALPVRTAVNSVLTFQETVTASRFADSAVAVRTERRRVVLADRYSHDTLGRMKDASQTDSW